MEKKQGHLKKKIKLVPGEGGFIIYFGAHAKFKNPTQHLSDRKGRASEE